MPQRRKSYSDLLKDPRWQRKRLAILEAAGWKCRGCGEGSKQLHVHHGYYERGRMPWDYEDGTLWVLCVDCHELAEEARRDYYYELAFVNPMVLSPAAPLYGYEDTDRQYRRRGDFEERAADLAQDPVLIEMAEGRRRT